MKASGKIKKIIVLLNSVNQVQADYINSANYDIDSILWVGEGGTSTTLGIGKILSGKVNPSGKITDTFYKKHYYNPVYSNFGDYANVGPVISSAMVENLIIMLFIRKEFILDIVILKLDMRMSF